jgi:hypothetical protein
MRSFIPFSLFIALSFAVANVPRLRADPVSEVASFSLFKAEQVDLPKLSKGEVIVATGPSMGFARGLKVESLYVLPMAVSKSNELLQRWNGAQHTALKVYQHVNLPRKPSLQDFQKLADAPANSAVRSFVAATEKLNPDRPGLQMSAAEAKQFGGSDGGAKGAMPANVSAFWSALLHRRASAFVEGGLSGQPAYASGGKPVRAIDEANELLRERPAVRKQFSALADAMLGGRASSGLFYEMFDVEGRAAVALGADCSRSAGEGWQRGILNFYSSDGYYVMLTFTQLWPVQLDGKEATLAWRGDLLSAGRLGELRGIERAGSAVAMRKEIQKTVTAMVKDLSSRR